MTNAENILSKNSDTVDIIEALERDETEILEVDQNWEQEATTWTLSDGSKVRVSGPFAEAISANGQCLKSI